MQETTPEKGEESEGESDRQKPERPPPPKVKHALPSVQAHLEQLQPLSPEKVRWFYKEDKKWVPFNGSDSLVIERVYRRHHGMQGFRESMSFDEFSDASDWKEYCPTVRGNVYEVNVQERICYPIYWKDESVRILRGTWFQSAANDTWKPLEEVNAELLEEKHMSLLRSLGVGSLSTVDNESLVLCRMDIWSGYCVEWHDISDVRLVNKSTSSKLVQKIGLSGPTPLARGYHTECDKTDAPSDIGAMVFVIHGIGQIIFSHGGVHNNCKKLRATLDKVMKYFTRANEKRRVEFFPVEWRTGLKLDEGILDSITPSSAEGVRKLLNESTMDVMYYTSPSFRLEIMRTLREQVNSIYVKFCNRNPGFAEKGKVSFIAHSLGSVILYDVLKSWHAEMTGEEDQQVNTYLPFEDAELACATLDRIGGRQNTRTISCPSEHDDDSEQMEVAGGEVNLSRQESETGKGADELLQQEMETSEVEVDALRRQLHAAKVKVMRLESELSAAGVVNKSKEYLANNSMSLKFKVSNAFNIGSPLGAFLVMRGVRPNGDLQPQVLPFSVCENMYNIYEPTDPIAYRIEPLLYSHYKDVSPIRLSNITKDEQSKNDSGKRGMAAAPAGWIRGWFWQGKSQEAVEYQPKGIVLPRSEEQKDAELLSDKAVLDHRLDFVLDSGFVEILSVMTSHMSYWSNTDLMKFVLYTIYAKMKEG